MRRTSWRKTAELSKKMEWKHSEEGVLLTWTVKAIDKKILAFDGIGSGEWNRQDQLAVSTAASSMLASLATMALIPAWSRINGLVGNAQTVSGKAQVIRLTKAATKTWTSGLQYKALFKSFAIRAIAVSALSVIAAAAEYFQVQEEIGGAESEDRKNALRAKLFITAVIGAVAAFQLMTSAATWLGVMSASLTIAPWMVIALAMLGMAHLIISLISDSLKLEGF